MSPITENPQLTKTPKSLSEGLNPQLSVDAPIEVSEIVSTVANENEGRNDGAVVTTQTTGVFDFAFGNRIRSLLFQPKKQSYKLPKPEVQKVRVKKALEKETDILIKQAKKIARTGRFSAFKLEKIINQIRFLQQLLEELVTATVEKLENLYRQYVLKLA